ncbi:MAG: hypothetical protein JEZ02_19515 [Desulfatibacillum sp.]|nr:hypothetical protein [Desulfatibacillum sp.]
MKKYHMLAFALLLLLLPQASHAKAPIQIGGFTLGQNVSSYQNQIIPGTAMAVYENGMCEEVQVKVSNGFKTGSMQYGVCADPGRIVHVEFKYEDSSKQFFDKLLEQCKKQFGNPNEYKGDSFRVFIAWKWIFFDDQNNRITLKIQHNAKDEEQRLGNVIKLTMTNLVDNERKCWRESMKSRDGEKQVRQGKVNWDQLLPR